MIKVKKKVISFLLLISMLLSAPITSIAKDPVLGDGGMQDNTASDGETDYNTGKNPSSSDIKNAIEAETKYWIMPENQGIRISIVDASGNRVTNSIDIVQYNPFGLLDGTAPANLVARWNEFNDYFGNRTFDGKTKSNSFFFSNGIKTEEYTPETWNQNCVPNAKVNGKDVETNIYEKAIFENYLNYFYELRLTELGIAPKDGGKKLTIEMPIIWGNPVKPGGAELMKVLRSPLGNIGADNENGDENVITVLVNMSIDKCDNRGKPNGGAVHLFRFIDPNLESLIGQDKSKLSTISGGSSSEFSSDTDGSGNNSINTSSTDNSGKIRASEIIMIKGYKIVVEPIFWDVMSMGSLNENFFLQFQNSGSLPAVCYGTVSYLNKYAYEKSKEAFGFSDDIMNSIFLGQHWRESFIGVETLKLAFEDKELGIKTIQEGGLNPVPGRDGLNYYTSAQLASGDNYKNIGYSVHIYDKLLQTSDSGTPTWDKPTYPPNNYKPGPSPENTNPDGTPKLPDYPPEGDEYKITNTDHKFHIVKFYAEKQPDGTYKYKENHTRDNTVHTININDEPNYKVDNYYTSTTYTKPTNPTDDYDVWKSSKATKTTYEGTKAERLTVKPSDSDTTLYIRLVSTPMLTVVKYFPDKDKTVEEIPWQPSYDTTEPGYEYEKDKQNPDKPDDIPNTFESTTGTPGSNPIIPVDPTSRIVYIKYKQPEADSKITLHQNELAHTFTLEDIQSLVTLKHDFPSKEKTGRDTHYCGGCRTDSDGDSYCPGHRCTWERLIDDNQYSYIISNKEDYSSTTFVGSQGAFQSEETGTVNDSGTLGMSGGITGGLSPNLKFSIYRDKVKDNVTLYPNKNNGVKSELSQIYITAEGYTPQTQRVLEQGQTEWFSSFKVNYTYDKNDNDLSWYTSCSYDGTNHDSGSWSGKPEDGLDTINSPYSQPSNVLTKAYLGQPGTGDKISEMEKVPFEAFGKNFTRNLRFVPNAEESGKFANDGKFFEFYPYIEMEYQTVTDLNNKLAYIVSTNLSKVRNNTAVEVGVFKGAGEYGINLSSEQWSTHARTIEGLRQNSIDNSLLNKSLIPGGAVVKLNTSNNAQSGERTQEVWVGFRTYEMSIPDDLKVSLSATDGVKTTSEAKTAANTFFEDVKNNLSSYHVEKWIKPGITKNENDLNNATKVSGIRTVDGTPATSFGGNALSTDKKYYLKNNVSDATSSKFDVINSSFEQHVYKIYSDVYGKVTVTKDGAEIASANIKSERNVSSLLSNTEVKKINDRVRFVDNFVQSLDFEGGKDRESIPWYYEAQDGIEVVESIGAVQVGFGGNNPIRSEVVDPKLTGKLENRDDTLNFDSDKLDEKTRTVQYRMSAAPTTKPEIAGYIGTFNGLDIKVPTMNSVMRTRLHYMGNNTVMDLN